MDILEVPKNEKKSYFISFLHAFLNFNVLCHKLFFGIFSMFFYPSHIKNALQFCKDNEQGDTN